MKSEVALYTLITDARTRTWQECCRARAFLSDDVIESVAAAAGRVRASEPSAIGSAS